MSKRVKSLESAPPALPGEAGARMCLGACGLRFASSHSANRFCKDCLRGQHSPRGLRVASTTVHVGEATYRIDD